MTGALGGLVSRSDCAGVGAVVGASSLPGPGDS